MLGYIIYRKEDAKKNERYIAMYHEEGEKLGITFEVLYVEELAYGIADNTWSIYYQGRPLMHPDFAVVRTINPLLSRQLHVLNIPVFNSPEVAEICNDKARTYQEMASLSIPMIPTEFCKYEQIEEKLEKATQRSVVKTVSGHGGTEVFLIEPGNREQIHQMLRRISFKDVVIQPFVGTKHEDLRVYVIGDRIVGAVLRQAKEGFKSNFSLGGFVSLYSLSEQEEILVHKIIKKLKPDMVGIDFIIGDHNELIFNEIEDVVGARMLYKVSNINLVGEYLQYIQNKIKK